MRWVVMWVGGVEGWRESAWRDELDMETSSTGGGISSKVYDSVMKRPCVMRARMVGAAAILRSRARDGEEREDDRPHDKVGERTDNNLQTSPH